MMRSTLLKADERELAARFVNANENKTVTFQIVVLLLPFLKKTDKNPALKRVISASPMTFACSDLFELGKLSNP